MTALIAFVGRPNVGKSTLFNRLVGRSQALVDDLPGVTRDRNFGQADLFSRKVTVVDTGGFDPTKEDHLIGQIREQALLALDEADLIVLVVDGKNGLSPHDKELADLIRRSGEPCVVAVNKIDGPEKEFNRHEFYALGLKEICSVSAAHGYGISDFKTLLLKNLPKENQDIVINENQIPKIAVVGRPNAGKSSLINQLAGQNRLVVDSIPGTTRDSVDVTIKEGQLEYCFIDTAGVRRKGQVSEKLEKISVMRALRSLERADLAILVVDAFEGLADQDASICGYAVERGCPLIILANKWDKFPGNQKKDATKELKRQLSLKMPFVEYVPFLTASAQSGKGLKALFPTIELIMKQYKFRATTSEVNQVLQKAITEHAPPQLGRGRLKLYYATQVKSEPPTFLVFVSQPKMVHFSYQRYLQNKFKESFALDKIPIKMIFRARRPERLLAVDKNKNSGRKRKRDKR